MKLSIIPFNQIETALQLSRRRCHLLVSCECWLLLNCSSPIRSGQETIRISMAGVMVQSLQSKEFIDVVDTFWSCLEFEIGCLSACATNFQDSFSRNMEKWREHELPHHLHLHRLAQLIMTPSLHEKGSDRPFEPQLTNTDSKNRDLIARLRRRYTTRSCCLARQPRKDWFLVSHEWNPRKLPVTTEAKGTLIAMKVESPLLGDLARNCLL